MFDNSIEVSPVSSTRSETGKRRRQSAPVPSLFGTYVGGSIVDRIRELSREAPPFPLSSRAQPRDLQFSGPSWKCFPQSAE